MTTQPAFQKLAETAHRNAEQFQAWAQITLDASEKLLAINFGAARSLCESLSANPAPLASSSVSPAGRPVAGVGCRLACAW